MKFLKWSGFFLLFSDTVFGKAEPEDQKMLEDDFEEFVNAFGEHKDIFKAVDLSLHSSDVPEADVKRFLKIMRKKKHPKFPLLESVCLWEGVGLEVLYKAAMPKLRSIGFKEDTVHNFNKFFKLKEKIRSEVYILADAILKEKMSKRACRCPGSLQFLLPVLLCMT